MFNELHAFPAALYGGFNSWTIQAYSHHSSSHRSDCSTGGQFAGMNATGDPSFPLCSC